MESSMMQVVAMAQARWVLETHLSPSISYPADHPFRQDCSVVVPLGTPGEGSGREDRIGSEDFLGRMLALCNTCPDYLG